MADATAIVFPGNRYLALSKLGAGAFGEVYKARDTLLNRTVAIKRIRMDAFADQDQLEEVKQRFLREAQVAAQLKHPNIVTIYDIVADADMSFIVMEFIEGVTLQAMLQARKRLSLKETVDLLSQAADALDHAHQEKVVHRDIKPANIMIEPAGRAKVTDFGIAKAESTANLTATGAVLGTPNYMSPEQARGDKVDGRSDLFSLGCIVYECLVGQKPFRGETLTAVLMKIISEEPPPIDCRSRGLPAGVEGVLRQALAKRPDERYPTGREIMAPLLRMSALASSAGDADATLGSATLETGAPVPPTARQPSPDRTAAAPSPGPPLPPPPPPERSVTIRKPPLAREPASSRAGLKIAAVFAVALIAAGVGIYIWIWPAPPLVSPPPASTTTPLVREATSPPSIASVTTVAPSTSVVASTSAPVTSIPPPSTPTTVPPVSRQEEPPPEPPTEEPPSEPRVPGGRIRDKRGIYGNRTFTPRSETPMVRANESAVVERLKFLVAFQNGFHQSRGHFGTPDELLTFAQMGGQNGELLRQPVHRGYRFQIRVESKDFYSATATPVEYGVSGVRSFYVDASGRVRGSNRYGEPADASDPEIR